MARLVQAVRSAAETDSVAGRLFPWLPVAFGFGVVLYFTADTEPNLWAAAILACVTLAATYVARNRPIGFVIAVAVAGIATGFATAALRTRLIAHPILPTILSGATVTGWVMVSEERERSDRITIAVKDITARGLHVKPERVRVAVRKGLAPPLGSLIRFKARLSPPVQPLRPGGYDFARDLYYQQIGASGFVLGRIEILPVEAVPTWRVRYLAAIGTLRDAMDIRIRTVLKGDTGSIASALITGRHDAISKPVNDALYISSLAHVLSISGYHMAVVAGIVFFIIRALLALVPALAVRHPIKKYAAFGALLASTFYLLLSGAEVATQRSYYMIAIVLVGVMCDRPTMTLRTLALAALAVLLLAPEAVAHPSFQMSFAATLALIATYRNGLPFLKADMSTTMGKRFALWGGREVCALILASLVAGLATTPYSAFHFHRAAPYGVIANLLAMPVVSAVAMPAGIVGVVAMPFGFDGICWQIMGYGIDWMNTVSLWVASLPGAVGRVPAFGTGPLLLMTASMLLLCLLRSWLRYAGVPLALIAIVWVAMTRQPDIWISPDGEAVAVRGNDGRIAVARTRKNVFAIREWLAADADARLFNDPTLDHDVTCDHEGCVVALRGSGMLVANPREIAAIAEDCATAVIVVTPRSNALPDCKAMVFDRDRLRRTGAVALWMAEKGSAAESGGSTEKGLTMRVAYPAGYDRPWARPALPKAATAPAPATQGRQVGPRRTPDATPSTESLEPGDAESDAASSQSTAHQPERMLLQR